MEIKLFHKRIKQIMQEAQSLESTITNMQDIEQLKKLMALLGQIEMFFCETQNINVLEEYNVKPENNRDNCPLDILCKDVLEKLAPIEPLLVSSIFEFLQPENNNERSRFVHRNKAAASFNNLIILLTELIESKLLSFFEILKHLAGHSKTLIVLGPNGSGKTSFANFLKNAEKHVKVIPASKPIRAKGYIPNLYNSTIDTFNDEIYGDNQNLREDLLQKLIIGLCTEHDNMARKLYDTGKKEESTFVKVKQVFDSFFDVELDDSQFANKEMQAQKGTQQPFQFNNMSDGERAAFFYIATVIVAPQKSFIIVDEPENHLNPAIYNKIWDKLIGIRKDCQFIFISHTMEFISARSNFELVKIKNFIYPNKFEFEFLGSELENVNAEYIVEIIGSRKPILFCEGSRADFDYKIYEILFGDKYTVIPTGNCLTVENSVEACNMHSVTYSIQSAIGIIDSDLRSTDEIERLKAKKVYVLKCNEIEMLLLDKIIFKRVLKQIYKEESDFKLFEDAFFRKLDERKQHIIKRLVKTRIDEKLQSSIIDDKANKTQEKMKENLTNIFTALNVDVLWSECDTRISEIIAHKDYDAALQYCCLEHNEILVGVSKPFVNDYATIALGVLKDDSALSKKIINKYFSEISL